jgi:hypothetical protein
MNKTFNIPEATIDGQTYHAGEVVRFTGDNGEPWGDGIIVGFSNDLDVEDIEVRLARPMAYIMSPDVSPRVTLSFEQFDVALTSLPRRFTRIGKYRDGYSRFTL